MCKPGCLSLDSVVLWSDFAIVLGYVKNRRKWRHIGHNLAVQPLDHNLAVLRENYWIMFGQGAVKRKLKACVRCKRLWGSQHLSR